MHAPSQHYISPWVCARAVPDVLQGTLLISLACMATATPQLPLRGCTSSACTAFKHMYVVRTAAIVSDKLQRNPETRQPATTDDFTPGLCSGCLKLRASIREEAGRGPQSPVCNTRSSRGGGPSSLPPEQCTIPQPAGKPTEISCRSQLRSRKWIRQESLCLRIPHTAGVSGSPDVGEETDAGCACFSPGHAPHQELVLRCQMEVAPFTSNLCKIC